MGPADLSLLSCVILDKLTFVSDYLSLIHGDNNDIETSRVCGEDGILYVKGPNRLPDEEITY